MIDPLVVAFGLGVGILIGLTGNGGGSLMTPLLVLVVGVQPVVAIGTDLSYGAITKAVGGWRHLRSGAVDRGVSKWLAVGLGAWRNQRRAGRRAADRRRRSAAAWFRSARCSRARCSCGGWVWWRRGQGRGRGWGDGVVG